MLCASDAFLGTWRTKRGSRLAPGMVARPFLHILHAGPRMGSASGGSLGTRHAEAGLPLASLWMVTLPLGDILHAKLLVSSASDADLGIWPAEARLRLAALRMVAGLAQQVFHTLLLVLEASDCLFGASKTEASPNHATRMPAELVDVVNVLHTVLFVCKAFAGFPSPCKAKAGQCLATRVITALVAHILHAQLLAMGSAHGGDLGASLAIGRSRLAAWVLAALVDDILVAQLLAMGSASGGDLSAGLAVG